VTGAPAKPDRPSLADALAAGPLLLDGAMGSLLYERGVLHTRSYDELNLSQPELIRTVHADYAAAGAEVIETNTFGANRMALARHGLAEQATAINQAGVALARAATEHRPHATYVAGAVGPTGVRYAIATEAERRLFRQLLKIAGVGARTALAVLSGMSVAELSDAVISQDTGRLTKVPGIGKKTAERLLLELKDKLGVESLAGTAVQRPTPAASDVLRALVSLGYSEKEALGAVKQLPENLTVADGIRQALKQLSKS